MKEFFEFVYENLLNEDGSSKKITSLKFLSMFTAKCMMRLSIKLF